MADDKKPVVNDPPENQPPAQNPPTISQTGNLLAPGQVGAQVTWGGQTGQPTGLGTVLAAGLPAFGRKDNSSAVQITTTDGTLTAQLQQNYILNQHGTSQQSLLLSEKLQMTPKLAAALGVNAEQDWGGDHPQRPKYQMIEQVYAGTDRGAQIGDNSGTAKTLGVSALGLRNLGLSEDLNPKYQLGVEVRVEGSRLDPGAVHQFMATGGAVGAANFKFNDGNAIITVGGTVFAGAEQHSGSPIKPVVGGGIIIGGSFDLVHTPSAPAPEPEKPTVIKETIVKGIVSDVDPEHNRVVMDIGSGKTQEYELSKLRGDAIHPERLEAALQRGERIDISTNQYGTTHVNDLGKDREWLKDDLIKHAEVEKNGDLKMGNLTVHKELADLYKPWLAKTGPMGQADNDLVDQLDKLASNKKEPTVLGRDDHDPPDFSRGSSEMPKLGVHMAADGKGGVRGVGLMMKGCTFAGVEDKDGMTTVNYTLAGRPMAISFTDTVGGYGTSPKNPYNEAGIDAALGGDQKAPQAGREVALDGAKALLRDTDAATGGPQSLVSAKGTSPTDLLKRATFDPNTSDVHIGNLTLKKDVAAFYLQALNNEGPRDQELVARMERLADAKSPTTIDLAKTKEAALKVRDELGFGEPPNPVKVALSELKPGDKFDFNIDKNGVGKVVDQTQQREAIVYPDRVDAHERPKELVHAQAPARGRD